MVRGAGVMVRIDNGLHRGDILSCTCVVRDGCIRSSDNRFMSTLEMKESSRSPTIDTVNFTETGTALLIRSDQFETRGALAFLCPVSLYSRAVPHLTQAVIGQ